MGIPDPCGNELGYQRILATFIKQLSLTTFCKAPTVRGYAEAVNFLFQARKFTLPYDRDNKTNMVTTLLTNIEKEDDVAKKSSPLTIEMFAQLKIDADEQIEQGNIDSAEAVVFDLACYNKIYGCRSCEYAQKKQSTVEVHKYPSGKTVVKAFTRECWIFYDENGRMITNHCEANLAILGAMDTIWMIQKNRQNRQKIRTKANKKNPAICNVAAGYRMFLRSIRLKKKDTEPICVFVNKSNKTVYMTAAKVTEILRKVARKCHPDWTDEMINRITSHSFRVWALVLLSEVKTKAYTMQARLRWLGDSYRGYLRDTNVIAEQHRDAHEKMNSQVMALLAENINLDVNQVEAESQEEMGEYSEFD